MDPRRRRGQKRDRDTDEPSEPELIASLRRRAWWWLRGFRREADPEPEAPVLPAAEAANDVKPPARKPRGKREALPDPVATLRRRAWSWLGRSAPIEAKPARKPRPKREPLPEPIATLRRRAWMWLRPVTMGGDPPARSIRPVAPAKARPPSEPPKRRRPKREAVPEAVLALRRAAWTWLSPRPAAAPPAAAAPPEGEAPGKRRRPKREAVPEAVLDLRRRAWAWFAPRATGEAAAGTRAPLRVPREAEAVPGGEVVRSHLKGVIEALIFASEHPLPAREVARLARADLKVVKTLLAELSAEYHGRGFRLDEIAGGFVFRTSPLFAPFVREQVAKKPVKMSRAQIETLAIVAYRQPVTRPEIDDVRGVDSGAVLKSLLERDLVRILGKKDEPGRPMLYGTTGSFLEFFGLRALADLPTLREFTELTDESKRTYERELGEEPLEAGAIPGPGEGLMGGEGEFRRAAVEEGSVPTGDLESEPPSPEPASPEPPQSEPLESEPLESEPLESEPLESEPLESGPPESEPRASASGPEPRASASGPEPHESEPPESEPRASASGPEPRASASGDDGGAPEEEVAQEQEHEHEEGEEGEDEEEEDEEDEDEEDEDEDDEDDDEEDEDEDDDEDEEEDDDE